ncbi:hypothetical protein [Streptosporangium sp. OZ121]|uniref:hypothetical protein n=1 Tax=Streptosporangium sp. OZ121 TaxID=3444183 RepID=UPI003F79CA2A
MARPRTYAPGDRVAFKTHDGTGIKFGLVGKVVEVIRRSNPPFFGYLISVNGLEPTEFQGALVTDPPRPLLDEWRKWNTECLGREFVAGLNDKRLAQLRREYVEAYPRLSRDFPHHIPNRMPGVEPLHHVTITRTTTRHTNRSSNGAFERQIAKVVVAALHLRLGAALRRKPGLGRPAQGRARSRPRHRKPIGHRGNRF